MKLCHHITRLSFTGLFLVLSACGGNQSQRLFGGPSSLAFITIPTPFQYDYGLVTVNSINDATFTVKNEGVREATSLTGVFTISAFSYKGGSFPGTGGSCQSTLAAQSSCTIVVTFSPTYADTFTEFIQLNYDNGQYTDLSTTVQLFGRSMASALLPHAEITKFLLANSQLGFPYHPY